MGLDADEFKIDGYLIANSDNDYNYFRQRDNLIAALKRAGAGILVHPYLGEINVLVKEKVSISETFEEGGICRLSMTFIQATGKPKFSDSAFDFIAIVDLSALDTMMAFLDTVQKSIKMATAFVSGTIGAIKGAINKVKNAIQGIANAITVLSNTISAGITAIVSSIDGQLNSPCDLARSIFNAADQMKASVGMLGTVKYGGAVGGCSGKRRGKSEELKGSNIPEKLGCSVVKSLITTQDYDETAFGVIPDEQLSNIKLVTNTSKASMIKTACEIAIRIDFTSQDMMLEVSSLVATAMDNLLLRMGEPDDNVDYTICYNAVQDLRDKFISSMYSKHASTAKEQNYTVPPDVNSALTLAHEKYYDLSRVDDIIYRNRKLVKHPGFMPSGNDLRLLNA
jgi:prophage DNA circulation protein